MTRYTYRVVYLPLRAAETERELNQWASAGFRLVTLLLVPREVEPGHVFMATLERDATMFTEPS